MNHKSHEIALLDANIVIHLLRMDATGRRIQAQHSFTDRHERPILSSVVEAEVLAFTRYREWGEKRTKQLRTFLREFLRVDVGSPPVVQAYVDLYCEAHRAGRYQHFRQNDLWIAATAHAAGAVVYTCNGRDFDWISPAYLTVVSIDSE